MPKSKERNQRLREDRLQQILAAAVKLFATRGLAATKIADIASAVGMSQGLLYHYFDSKEAIFVEIVRSAFDKMNTAARALETLPLTPRAKLELAAHEILRSLEQSEDFAWYSTLISMASVSDALPEQARSIIHEQREIPYEIVTRIVLAGQQDGSVRQGRAEDFSLLFWTSIKGLALHKATLGAAFRAPETVVLTGIFFDGAKS